MSNESAVPQKPSFLGRLWRVLIRLIFVIVVGIGLGIATFFGVSALYTQFIQPIQEHSLRLNALEGSYEQSSQQQSRRVDDLASRLDTLEAQGDTHKESLADLQTRLENLEGAQATQTAALGTTVEEMSALQSSLTDLLSSVESIQDTVDALEADMQVTEAGLEEAGASIDTISEEIENNTQNLQNLSALVEGEAARWEAMRHELVLLRVMELISRSRFFLVQNNLSLAQADIRAGRDLLLNLQNDLPANQVDLVFEAVERLEAALDDLPRAPVSAADELEGAWQLLLQGLPASPTPTPTPEVTPESVTVSPTPTPTQ